MKRSLRDISLSWRLTALYVAILAAVLAALGVVLYAQVEDFLIKDTAARLETAAQTTITRVIRGGDPRRGPGGPPPDQGRLGALTGDLASRDTVAQVFDSDGTILIN